MRYKTLFITTVISSILLTVVLGAAAKGTMGAAQAAEIQAAIGSAFTYQGYLSDDGSAANDVYDFEFRLFDSAGGGTQVGSTVAIDDVTVSNGRFTVELDFGDVFDGSSLYLEISVRAGAETGAYTTLSPRQALTPTPYALFAAKAGEASWNDLTDIPADIADGDDSSVYSAGDGLLLSGDEFSLDYAGTGTAVTAARSDHNHDDLYEAQFKRIVMVGPVGDGSDTEANGTALLNALDDITDASASNPYLLKIEPGIYDLGADSLAMKAYVAVEGSGEGVTTITSEGSSSAIDSTIIGEENSALRLVTVENRGGAAYAIGIRSSADSFAMQHVSVYASGGTTSSRGISLVGGDGETSLDDVRVIMDGLASSSTSYGILQFASIGDRTLLLDNVTVEISGTGGLLYGILSYAQTGGQISTVTATNVFVTAVSSGGNVYGISSERGSQVTLSNVFVDVTATSNNTARALFTTNGGGFTATNVTASAKETTSGSAYGLYMNSSTAGTAVLDHVKISGDTYAVQNASSGAHIVRIGASMVAGGVDEGSGTITCYASYDADYVNHNDVSACP